MTDKKKDAKGDVATEMLIQEIEDDLKQEQYAKLWNKFGGVVIGACVAIVAVVAGYQGWQSYYTSQRKTEAAAFAAATVLPPAEASAALDKLALDARTGYATLAELRRAAVLAQAGDTKAAVAAYDTIAAKPSVDQVYRDLAVLRSVMLTLGDGDAAALTLRLQPLLSTGWRHSALELQALLAQRQGNADRARQIFQQLTDDTATPQALRARAAEMLAVIGEPASSDKKG